MCWIDGDGAQALREEADRNRAEVAERDERWRCSSRQLSEQLAALRDDNEDLRFQVSMRLTFLFCSCCC